VAAPVAVAWWRRLTARVVELIWQASAAASAWYAVVSSSDLTWPRAIDNFIVRLRKYLEDRPGSPQFLRTVRGVGYKFQPEAPKNAH
jgi:hypothetical protein